VGDAPVDNTVYTFAYRYTYDDAGNMTSKKKIAMVRLLKRARAVIAHRIKKALMMTNKNRLS